MGGLCDYRPNLGRWWQDPDSFLTPEIEKSYVARKATHGLASGEFFLGMQKELPFLPSQWLGQIGLAIATTSNAKLEGNVWDDADPQFDNYRYQYSLHSTRVALKGLLLLDKGYWVTPWVSASLGVGFNRAHGYNNTPLIFQAVADSNFTDHTKTSFTNTLGAGIQKPINLHWQIGMGYEFADWGKSALGRSSGQTMNTGLALEHLYTHGVSFNLTYIS